jgi:primosomal protein N' (replication factor Y)
MQAAEPFSLPSNRHLLRFADVILPLALPRNFTYEVPPELEGAVKPGCRAAVQFGATRKYAAIIRSVHDQPPEAYQTKPLLYLLDEEPVVHPRQLALWEWMASYYMCTEGEVMHAALPAHLKLTSETRLILNPAYSTDPAGLEDEEYLVAEALQVKQELTIAEVQQIVGKLQVYLLVKQLLDKQVCLVYEELKEAYKPREERILWLHDRCAGEKAMAAVFEEVQRAPRQMETLLAFLHLQKTEGVVRQGDLQRKAGVSSAIVKGLVDKGILVSGSREVERLPMRGGEISVDFTLNAEQQAALEQIRDLFTRLQTVLVQGVTSSGKTMLYIKLMEEYMRQGRQVLYLLPEIALTAQIVRRLQKHFGDQVAIYHSKFSPNERVEIWDKVKTGRCRLVLGARSALLLPFTDLGLLILDEEHDASYKQQDPAPRYHARDTAIYYAGLFGARVLLGSATPSLESSYNARSGKYGLVTMKTRYGGMKMPDITLVDMKQPSPPGRTAPAYLSVALHQAMQASLAADRQVILFQNRRGYAPMMVCTTCGWIPHCNQCDVSLTFHKFHQRLHCHYCGRQYPVPEICAACGNPTVVSRNFGTERIEDDLAGCFPGARIARMDLDSVRNKDAHRKLIELFEQKRIDVLVGTQMVVKGLDFDHVTLVGILSADNLLSYPDFRVHERAFQLMEQVSGRAGRREERGGVLIQTVNPAHPVLDFVLRHDYDGFYESEMAERERFGYPPFTRLVRLVLRHKQQQTVREAAGVLAASLTPVFGDRLLGPSVPLVGRVRGYYLSELLVKLPRHGKKIPEAKAVMLEKIAALQAAAPFRRVFVLADVDCL